MLALDHPLVGDDVAHASILHVDILYGDIAHELDVLRHCQMGQRGSRA